MKGRMGGQDMRFLMMVLLRYILCIIAVSFEVAFAFISSTKEQNYICNNDRTKYQFQLHATQSSTNPLLELMKVVTSNNDKEEIDSIHDFDIDLANEIQEALQSSVGIVGEEDTNINNIDDTTIVDKNDNNREESGKKTVLLQPHPPTSPPPQLCRDTNNKPVLLPPHTALAQVLANQYGINLNDIVMPSSTKGSSKITAEDVEYYAWKISQPPCTTEALELAYSLDMDLNEIYDDEDRETIMDIDDVKLFRDHSSSLKMSSQIFVSKNGSVHKLDNDTQLSKKRMSKMSSLDERLEAKMNKLSQKATKVVDQIKETVTDGVIQQVQSVARVNVNGQTTAQHEYNAVQDFDVDLASEIEAALSMANIHEETVEDDTAMAAVESASTTGVIEEEDDETSVTAVFSPEELQSMTCVQLKVLLKRRGLKVSGKKSVLVERLIDDDSNEEDTSVNDQGDNSDNGSDSPLFFANLQK